MKNDLWYFAHPYTLTDIHGCIIPNSQQVMYDLCRKRTGILLRNGYKVFSPITHSHGLGDFSWEFWMAYDKFLIETIDFTGIILAPGWEDSKGCRFENDLFFDMEGKAVTKYSDMILL